MLLYDLLRTYSEIDAWMQCQVTFRHDSSLLEVGLRVCLCVYVSGLSRANLANRWSDQC